MLQEGVVFAISGIQNPLRALFRTQGLEMGAQYRPDWSSDCTVLVCAFKDTPKFKQVKADGGSIVSKVSWHLFLNYIPQWTY
jgi:DNA-repair protein XRCC1